MPVRIWPPGLNEIEPSLSNLPSWDGLSGQVGKATTRCNMDEQLHTEKPGTNGISPTQNLRPILFDQALLETGGGAQQFLWRQRLDALTQIYLTFDLPAQIAVRAAEADLRQVDARKTY